MLSPDFRPWISRPSDMVRSTWDLVAGSQEVMRSCFLDCGAGKPGTRLETGPAVVMEAEEAGETLSRRILSSWASWASYLALVVDSDLVRARVVEVTAASGSVIYWCTGFLTGASGRVH